MRLQPTSQGARDKIRWRSIELMWPRPLLAAETPRYPFAVEMTCQPPQHVKNADLTEDMATETVEELA